MRLIYGEGHYQLPPEGVVRFGRNPDNEIILNNPIISRYHANIQIDCGRATLFDCGSKNGTFIKGERDLDPVPEEGVELNVGLSFWIAGLEVEVIADE